MKILFIGYYNFVEKPALIYMAGYLKKNGFICDYLDVRFERNLIKKIIEINPQIIAYSITTPWHQYFLKINKKIKSKFECFSIFGGPHTTFSPEFINEESVDAICIGEGEEALTELAVKLNNNLDITSIRNLWIKQEGIIYKNEIRPMHQSIDEISIPDRDIFNKYRHYKNMKRRFLLTTRECPYNCSYCFNESYRNLYKDKGYKIRQRSVANVINELIEIKDKYNPKTIKFYDDIFILNKSWLKEFAIEYKEKINLPFLAHVRLNLVSEEIVQILKQAGCHEVEFGIESGNYEYRKQILNREMSNDEIVKKCLLFRKYGIKTLAFNILGLPDETIEQSYETLRLNIEAKVNYAWTAIFQPFPKTKLYDYAVEKGYFSGNANDIPESIIYSKSVLKMKNIKQIKRLQFLFSIIVSFPILYNFSKLFIKLPLTKLYMLIMFAHRAWNYVFVLKQFHLKEALITEKFNNK